MACECSPRMHLGSATVVLRDGVTSYNDLADKPRINGVELVGDKTPGELGLTGSGGTGGGGETGQDGGQDAPDGYEVATDEDIDALFG